MFETFRQVLDLFSQAEKNRLVILLGIMFAASVSEVLGMSSLFFLLSVFSQPEESISSGILGRVYEGLGFHSVFAFQVALSLGTLVLVISGLAIRAFASYIIVRYAKMRGYTLSARMLAAYLHQPYTWFLQRNSAEIARNVLNECEGLVMRIIMPGLNVAIGCLYAAGILTLMLIVDPLITVATAAILGGGYALIFFNLRERLRALGKDILQANRERFLLTQEASSGFKEVKLMGLEDSYTDRFRGPARRKARKEALNNVLNITPRYAMEALSFSVLLGVVLVLLVRSDGNLLEAIPTLGVFAFSALRLLPTLQQIYGGVASIKAHSATVESVHAQFIEALAYQEANPIRPAGDRRLPLDRALELDKVSFGYEGAARQAIEDFSLEIEARTTVGIVGGTGAGKTTLIDMILGLLPLESGQIRVDGQPLDPENVRAWQATIGYVPQSIYLIDADVTANIAFGVPTDKVDHDRVRHAAKTAALHDFVMQELPKGYETIVGERGVRLSGGQRQRIGIARALYNNPTLLVLDEATSALDNITERVVMEAIQNLRHDITIILIAHRLTTVRNCDRIFLMEHGKIAASGTYDELVAGNETFREMARGVG